jgi:hypothetical protein
MYIMLLRHATDNFAVRVTCKLGYVQYETSPHLRVTKGGVRMLCSQWWIQTHQFNFVKCVYVASSQSGTWKKCLVLYVVLTMVDTTTVAVQYKPAISILSNVFTQLNHSLKEDVMKFVSQ